MSLENLANFSNLEVEWLLGPFGLGVYEKEVAFTLFLHCLVYYKSSLETFGVGQYQIE